MDARSKALRSLTVDDIFHADSPNGASLICLVTSITNATIHARTVTTQLELAFNRMTGAVEMDADEIPGAIDSICRLPVDIHETMLGIDRKFRLETDLDKLKLTDAEIRAFLFVARHYPANPLPNAE